MDNAYQNTKVNPHTKVNKFYRMEKAVQLIHSHFNQYIRDQLGSDEVDSLMHKRKKISNSVYKVYLKKLHSIADDVCDMLKITDHQEIEGLKTFTKLAVLSPDFDIAERIIQKFSLKYENIFTIKDLMDVVYTHNAIIHKNKDDLYEAMMKDLHALREVYLYKDESKETNAVREMSYSKDFTIDLSMMYRDEDSVNINHHALCLRSPNNTSEQYNFELMRKVISVAISICVRPVNGNNPRFMEFFTEDESRMIDCVLKQDTKQRELEVWINSRAILFLTEAVNYLNHPEFAKQHELDYQLFKPAQLPYGFMNDLISMFIATAAFVTGTVEMDAATLKEIEDQQGKGIEIGLINHQGEISTDLDDVVAMAYLMARFKKTFHELKEDELIEEVGAGMKFTKEVQKNVLNISIRNDIAILSSILDVNYPVETIMQKIQPYLDLEDYYPPIKSAIDKTIKDRNILINTNDKPLIFDATQVHSSYS